MRIHWETILASTREKYENGKATGTDPEVALVNAIKSTFLEYDIPDGIEGINLAGRLRIALGTGQGTLTIRR